MSVKMLHIQTNVGGVLKAKSIVDLFICDIVLIATWNDTAILKNDQQKKRLTRV